MADFMPVTFYFLHLDPIYHHISVGSYLPPPMYPLGRIYKVGYNTDGEQSWNAAKGYCASEGGRLAHIGNADMNKFLAAYR
jgi:hypothetical protein